MPMANASSEWSLELLLDSSQLAARIRELGAEISRDYQGRTPHMVGVLKGAWVFMADLVRNLSLEATVDFLGIQSYVTGTSPSGEVKISKDLDVSIAGRDVLLVEDILDTGQTYLYLQGLLSAHQPRSLKLVALLDKTSRRAVPVRADYVGFQIPDVFVVGYGLDYNQQFRRLPEVYFLRQGGSA